MFDSFSPVDVVIADVSKQSDESAAEEDEFEALLERAAQTLKNRTSESSGQRRFNQAGRSIPFFLKRSRY